FPGMEIEGRSLARLRDDAEVAVTVAAAYDAGLFEALGQGPATLDELARRTGFHRRALAIVLGALESWGLVSEREGRWLPGAACRDGLCDPGSGAFVGGGLP